MTSFLIISGSKIVLRDWKLDDLPLWEYWLQPDRDWYQTDGPYYHPPSEDQIRAKVEAIRNDIRENQWPTPRKAFVIADRQSDQLIGRVSWYWQDQATNWLSVGIGIYDPNYRRKGIGFEALGLWTDYLFSALPDIVRLDLRTWSGNIGMIRLAEKSGYIQEARFRKARIVNGQYFDSLGYGILREEWVKKHPHGFLVNAS